MKCVNLRGKKMHLAGAGSWIITDASMIGAIHAVLKKPILYLKEQLPPGQFFVLASALVGLTSGLAAVTLKYCVHSIERLVTYYSNVFEEFFVFALFPLVLIPTSTSPFLHMACTSRL